MQEPAVLIKVVLFANEGSVVPAGVNMTQRQEPLGFAVDESSSREAHRL